jgi:hypothetical protein
MAWQYERKSWRFPWAILGLGALILLIVFCVHQSVN